MNNLSNELQIFQNPLFGEVRTIELNQKVWFGASDIAKALGYSNPRKAIATHCKSAGVTIRDVGVKTGERPDGTPIIQDIKMNFINEGNVIRLVSRCKMPKADEFESWIFDDLVPTVLKTGGYIIEKEGDTEEDLLARAFVVAQNKLKEREQRIALLEDQNKLSKEQLQIAAPKVEYFDNVLQSSNTYTTTQIAKEFGFSAETLNKKLKEKGIQYKQNGQWLLTYKYQNKGYTKTKTVTYTKADGSQGSSMQTVWTERGRLFIHGIIKAN